MTDKVEYIGEIEKQPSEKWPLTIDFASKMPTAVTLSSCAVSGYDLLAQTTDNSVLSGTTASVSGTTASVFVQAGTDRRNYRITFAATLSDSSVLYEDVLMRVKGPLT